MLNPSEDLVGYINGQTAQSIGIENYYYSVWSHYNGGNSAQLLIPINSNIKAPYIRVKRSDIDFNYRLLTNADLGYVVKEIQSFSVTTNNGYATLGTPQEFGVPSGAHVIACTLIGWSSLSSGDIYLTASDTGVYIISGESSITATYIRFRLTYINI